MMLAPVRHEPNLLKKVVTGDETWVSHFDPLLKQELSFKSFYNRNIKLIL